MSRERSILIIGGFALTLFVLLYFREDIESYGHLIEAVGVAATAVFTGTLWLSTRNLWMATKASVDLLQKEFDAMHRPKIRIKHVWLDRPIAPGEPTRISVVVVNIGDTSAVTKRFQIAVHQSVQREMLPNDPFVAAVELQLGDIEIPSGRTVQFKPVGLGTMDSDGIQRLRQLSDNFYCFAALEYTDKSGAMSYKTSCCRILTAAYLPGAIETNGRFDRVNFESDHEYMD